VSGINSVFVIYDVRVDSIPNKYSVFTAVFSFYISNSFLFRDCLCKTFSDLSTFYVHLKLRDIVYFMLKLCFYAIPSQHSSMLSS